MVRVFTCDLPDCDSITSNNPAHHSNALNNVERRVKTTPDTHPRYTHTHTHKHHKTYEAHTPSHGQEWL